MKAKTYVCALLIMLLILCVACQPSPEKPVVVGKDQAVMLDAAQDLGETAKSGVKLPSLQVPERYVFSTTGASERLKVTADAPIIIPTDAKLPIVKVVPSAFFTQQMVSGILGFLFGDAPYYITERELILTKSEIEAIIIEEQARIASGAYEPGVVDEIKEHIKELERMYESAPESKPLPILSDGMMTFDSQIGADTLFVNSFEPGTNHAISVFACTSAPHNPNDLDAAESILYYSAQAYKDHGYVAYTMRDGLLIEQEADIPEEAKAQLGITLEQAKEEMQRFFEAAGVSDMFCSAAYLLAIEKTDGISEATGEIIDYAYKLFYSRRISGTPILTLGQIVHSLNDGHNYFWDYERLEVDINEHGILHINWNPPLEETDIISEDSYIMSFEEAAEIFEAKALTFFEARAAADSAQNMNVDIDRVELGLLRIKEQNTAGKSGLYVPVWAFYGNVYTASEYYEGNMRVNGVYDWPQGPYIVLAVNAVDGSIINVELEY